MTKLPKVLDEATLSQIAYRGYLCGRLAGAVTPESPARWTLVQRYSAPSRQPCEVYCFLAGIRESGCPLSSPEELLGQAYRELGMEALS